MFALGAATAAVCCGKRFQRMRKIECFECWVIVEGDDELRVVGREFDAQATVTSWNELAGPLGLPARRFERRQARLLPMDGSSDDRVRVPA